MKVELHEMNWYGVGIHLAISYVLYNEWIAKISNILQDK